MPLRLALNAVIIENLNTPRIISNRKTTLGGKDVNAVPSLKYRLVEARNAVEGAQLHVLSGLVLHSHRGRTISCLIILYHEIHRPKYFIVQSTVNASIYLWSRLKQYMCCYVMCCAVCFVHVPEAMSCHKQA